MRDTTNATVQGDVFSPPQSGGPGRARPPASGTSFGKTVWYDFYPDVNGLVRLRASGLRHGAGRRAVQPQDGPPELRVRALRQRVEPAPRRSSWSRCAGGDAYSVQIGGVGDAGGPLEFLFDFLADTDGDGVLDTVDRCDRLDGPAGNNGCPRRQRVNTTLRALPTASGIEVDAPDREAPGAAHASW